MFSPESCWVMFYCILIVFFFNDTATTEIYTLSLHDALPIRDHHDLLTSNVFAQAQALAFGKTLEQVLAEGTDPSIAPHRVMAGNRPSNVILAEVLAAAIIPELTSGPEPALGHDSSTNALIRRYRLLKGA